MRLIARDEGEAGLASAAVAGDQLAQRGVGEASERIDQGLGNGFGAMKTLVPLAAEAIDQVALVAGRVEAGVRRPHGIVVCADDADRHLKMAVPELAPVQLPLQRLLVLDNADRPNTYYDTTFVANAPGGSPESIHALLSAALKLSLRLDEPVDVQQINLGAGAASQVAVFHRRTEGLCAIAIMSYPVIDKTAVCDMLCRLTELDPATLTTRQIDEIRRTSMARFMSREQRKLLEAKCSPIEPEAQASG